jgi:hypothetical protein
LSGIFPAETKISGYFLTTGMACGAPYSGYGIRLRRDNSCDFRVMKKYQHTSTNAPVLGAHLFSISYAGCELSCYVRRRGDLLSVTLDETLQAQLKIEDDGNLRQLSGGELSESIITSIKKQVLKK